MADDEQFSLCWNNFNSNLSAGFHESLLRGDLVDVTLCAEGHFVKAHRLVLSVCSPYFRNMFNSAPANQHAFVFLKDVSHSALKDLIQFMYCGEVNVKQDALATFISTAESLQIKGLTETGESAPSPIKQQTTSNTLSTSPRLRQQTRPVSRTVYKLESEDSSDDKPIVQKRVQRVMVPSSGAKRLKTDSLQSSEPTIIATVDTKGDGEFIELPIEMPSKSETEYADDTEEAEGGDQETAYVEDDTYADLKYDESYFTENEDTKAGISGFSESYEGDQQPGDGQGFYGFITGFRGSQKLKVGDFSFTKNKVNGTKTYWSCARAALHKCKARVVTIKNGDVQNVSVRCAVHNHDPF